MIYIRRVDIDSDDVDVIRSINARLLPGHPLVEGADLWAVYFGPDEIVGYAGGAIWTTGAYYLSRAGVDPAFRGQGIQRRLIQTRVRHARRLGCPRVVTYTHPHNAASINNLISCGFRTTKPWPGAGDGGDDGDWVYWRREL